jgi:hypothetical protein
MAFRVAWRERQSSTVSVDLVLLVDTSKSMGSRLGALQSSVAACVERLASGGGDGGGSSSWTHRVSLITFGAAARVEVAAAIAQHASTRDRVVAALGAVSPSGETDIGEGLLGALAHIGVLDPAAGRTVALVLITDGVSTVGTTDHGLILHAVRHALDAVRARCSIYAVGVGASHASDLLCDISEVSPAGGAYHFAPDAAALSHALQCCVDAARTTMAQEVVVVCPPGADKSTGSGDEDSQSLAPAPPSEPHPHPAPPPLPPQSPQAQTTEAHQLGERATRVPTVEQRAGSSFLSGALASGAAHPIGELCCGTWKRLSFDAPAVAAEGCTATYFDVARGSWEHVSLAAAEGTLVAARENPELPDNGWWAKIKPAVAAVLTLLREFGAGEGSLDGPEFEPLSCAMLAAIDALRWPQSGGRDVTSAADPGLLDGDASMNGLDERAQCSYLCNLMQLLSSRRTNFFGLGGVHALRAACQALLWQRRHSNVASVIAWLESEEKRSMNRAADDSVATATPLGTVDAPGQQTPKSAHQQLGCSHRRSRAARLLLSPGKKEKEEEEEEEEENGSSGAEVGSGESSSRSNTASPNVGALIAGRYEQRHYIGSGTYGTIRRATDVLSGTDVAIKWLSNVAKDRSKRVLTLRELHLLRALSGHPNIISLRDAVLEHHDDRVDLFIVMDLMEVDLQQLIDSRQVGQSSFLGACLVFAFAS